MPSFKETCNSAKYMSLQLGVQSAVHHGAKRLTIEGDSKLVIAQVWGAFSCSKTKLRQLQNQVRFALRSLDRYKLQHIDWQSNAHAHADRLVNRALDHRPTSWECVPHGGSMGACLAVPMTLRLYICGTPPRLLLMRTMKTTPSVVGINSPAAGATTAEAVLSRLAHACAWFAAASLEGHAVAHPAENRSRKAVRAEPRVPVSLERREAGGRVRAQRALEALRIVRVHGEDGGQESADRG
ncbi:hypothetical protein PF005_g13742 [Phytophthora fragariae]|uniref:RNase H type-1 domain-containing protein n=1 Tax=Phytophthora fragariae TaxID=53985 RepID=A0A6A3ZC04_9STRA|nr:hypothetical protein PF003_g39476 [Phytophthora fragariae]KAE8935009.1 hypothetical protein PF009_g15033 [Phytophthora fragariae]KAE9007547.1 hypothetical protein PF011_g11072 [Phytophthora fragariae]KAE9109708.1 hypothetical protein PF007_g12136 [Phytophthora fragariae]KAE9141896.1 hypothetical protein PF006_g12959 [Phytophthora fragariae]